MTPYHRRWVPGLGLGVLLFSSNMGLAGATAAAPSSLWFRDSMTGVAIVPDTILVDGNPLSSKADTAGKLQLPLAEGDHQVLVKAKGYRDFAAKHTAVAEVSFVNIMLLDPVTPPPQMQAETLRAASRSDAAMLAGYVVGDETGQPLENTRIALAGTSLAAVTDADGFFTVQVPWRAAQGSSTGQAVATDASKDVTAAKAGYRTHVQSGIVLTPGNTTWLNLRLLRGDAARMAGGQVRPSRLRESILNPMKVFDDRAAASRQNDGADAVPNSIAQAAPATIRVGRTCSCTACSTVVTVSMETYVKHVLPNEWITSWPAESLKAGAVAIRSYGAWYVYHPISGSYDICDTTCCQVYDDTTASSTNAAVDATDGEYMVDASGNIGRAEYSAENNNSGTCGNCYTINNPNDTVCLYDSVCCGATFNGHGRGMCQWGTQRWAANQGKDYTWMCDHYYSAYGWTRRDLGAPSPPTGVSASDGTYTDRVRVTWDAASGATGYEVWQATSNNSGSAGLISSPAGTAYDDYAASSGATYWYWVKAKNATGTSGFSASDSGYASAGAVIITQQPTNQTVATGNTTTFTVAATGAAPITYQWQKDGGNLSNGGQVSGATSTTLQIANVVATNQGGYRCVVTNPFGSVGSNTATLTVTSAPVVFIVESRLGGLNFANYSDTGWLESAGKSTAPGVTAGIGSKFAYISTSGLDAVFSFTPPTGGTYEVSVTGPSSTNAVPSAHHIITHASGSADVYVDQNNNSNPGYSTRWNAMGQYALNAGTAYRVTVTTTGSSGGTGSTVLRADAIRWELVGVVSPPTITQHPSAQNICPGGTATFSVSATGEGALAYQWQKNGGNLSDGGHYAGAATPTLTVSSADASDAANYLCVVTNAGGSTNSNAASLSLKAATTITQHPQAQQVGAGGTATFIVAATGEGSLTYQWQKNGANVSNGGHYSGVTTATLTVSSADTNDVATYRCVVTAGCGSATSNGANLTLIGAPTITQHPAGQSVCPGGTATFSVTATGSGTLTYQWQKNTSNLTNGGHYAGVATSTLTVSSADSNDEANYRCVVTNTGGSTPSNVAPLLLKSATTITQQPQSRQVAIGMTAGFAVAATGEGTLGYQWQKNGSNLTNGGRISGATSAQLRITSVADTDAGNYRCVVSGGCGSVTSSQAALIIGPAMMPGDFNADDDVDQSDFGAFQRCLSGDGVSQTDPSCAPAKLDLDNDVDGQDLLIFRGCMSGSGVAADPNCAAGV